MLSGWKRYLAISWYRAIKDKPKYLTSIVFDIVRYYLCTIVRNIVRYIVRYIVRIYRAIYRLDISCDISYDILWYPPNARGLMIQFGWFDLFVCLIFSHDVLVTSRNDIVAKCIEYLTTYRKIFVTKDVRDIWRYIVRYIARYRRILGAGNIRDISR